MVRFERKHMLFGWGQIWGDTRDRLAQGFRDNNQRALLRVLLGLLLARYSPLRAAVLSSALFGLWHVLPGIEALETTTATPSAMPTIDSQVCQGCLRRWRSALTSSRRFTTRVLRPVR